MNSKSIVAVATMLLAIASPRLEAAPATTRAATRPVASRPTTTSRPAPATRALAKPRAADPVRDAVAALFKETTDAAKAGRPFPRGDPDFLTGRTDLPQPRLLEELAQRQSVDARADAYIKWQLTSAVDRFDAANASAAIRAYVLGMPALTPMTSVDQRSRADWDRKVGQVNNKEEVTAVNEALEAELAKTAERNEIIIWYRDAIRGKIVADGADRPKFLAAQMEDLSQRAAAGINVEKDFTKLAKEIVAWAKSGEATRAQVGQVIGSAGEYVSRREPPTILTRLGWTEKTRKARWSSREAALEPDKVKALIKDLRAAQEVAKP